LAKEGMTGPYNAFDGVFGIWKQTLGKPGDFTLPKLGSDQSLGIVQTNIKKFPVRDSCQLPIDTALDLRGKISTSAIGELRVDTYKSAYAGAVADAELWCPQTRETADHSMPFTIAAALVDGDVTPETFEESRFKDKDILDLIGKMKIVVNDEFSKQTPGVRNCRISALTNDRREVFAHRQLTAAEIEKGISDQALEAKFERLTRSFMNRDARRRLIDSVWDLDNAPTVKRVIDLALL